MAGRRILTRLSNCSILIIEPDVACARGISPPTLPEASGSFLSPQHQSLPLSAHRKDYVSLQNAFLINVSAVGILEDLLDLLQLPGLLAAVGGFFSNATVRAKRAEPNALPVLYVFWGFSPPYPKKQRLESTLQKIGIAKCNIRSRYRPVCVNKPYFQIAQPFFVKENL